MYWLAAGFCVVFAVCEPVPDGVKTAFHLYGAADALFELVFITYAYKSIACVSSLTISLNSVA